MRPLERGEKRRRRGGEAGLHGPDRTEPNRTEPSVPEPRKRPFPLNIKLEISVVDRRDLPR